MTFASQTEFTILDSVWLWLSFNTSQYCIHDAFRQDLLREVKNDHKQVHNNDKFRPISHVGHVVSAFRYATPNSLDYTFCKIVRFLGWLNRDIVKCVLVPKQKWLNLKCQNSNQI